MSQRRPTTYSIRPWRYSGQPCFDRTTDLFLKPQIDSNAFNHRNRPITLNNLSSNILRLHKNFEANLSSLNEDQERRSALRRPLDAWIDNKDTTTSLIEPSIRVDLGKLIGIDLIVLEGYQGFVSVLGSTRKCGRPNRTYPSLYRSYRRQQIFKTDLYDTPKLVRLQLTKRTRGVLSFRSTTTSITIKRKRRRRLEFDRNDGIKNFLWQNVHAM